MTSYHIGSTSRGKKRQGGYRSPIWNYFGDERGSLIKFGIADTPTENETLRRSICAYNHIYSVEAIACPVCAIAREEARVAADIAAAVSRVRTMATFSGRCRQCGGKVAAKTKGATGRQRLYCGEDCRHRYGNERRG